MKRGGEGILLGYRERGGGGEVRMIWVPHVKYQISHYIHTCRLLCC